jgi:hypothetical protein
VDAVAKRHKTRKAQTGKAATRSSYYYHKVKYPGESISIIAKWYTGDVKNWRSVAKVNPKLDPNRITVGDKIRIPNKLLHTQKPMPRSFVVGSAKTAKKRSGPSTAGPPDKEPEVFELFGPK